MDFKVSIFLELGFILLLYLQIPVFAKDNKLKFCTVDSRKTHRIVYNECDHLVKSNNKEVECVVKSDRISCLKLLINGTVDFMTAEPEDLLVIGLTPEYNRNVLVTQELRIFENDPAGLEMVIIVHKSVENLWNTKRASLCLSGLEFDGAGVDHLRYFEKQFLVPECDPRKTLLENRISALSSYFEFACIGGPWTADKYFNTELKSKYSNLCSACDDPQNCLRGDIYAGPEGSLLCLTEGKGDIAWVKAADVFQHFQVLNISKEEYKFLCPNSKTRTLYGAPCVWLSKPWRTIIARKNVAARVSKFVIEQNQGSSDFPTLFEEDLYRVPVLVDPFKTPDDYLEMFPEYYALKDHVQCKPDRKIKWCVATSLEYQKCNWLSNAAQSRGVEPSIECVKEASLMDCASSVRNHNSDIFVIQSLNETDAMKKGLKPLSHMMSNVINPENEVVALVKKFSGFNSLEDLKNHNACFSGYRDIAWNTFIYLMGNLSGDNDWYCNDSKMVSELFNSSCVADLNPTNHTFPSNLYSICYTTELKVRESKALNCLAHKGDVAFLKLDIMQSYNETFGSFSNLQPKNIGQLYKPLCVNESTFESTPEKICSLTWTTLGTVMVHDNISQSREQEIHLMLLELDALFGNKFKGDTPQFSMYGPFEGTKNILFPEKTQVLKKDTDQIHRITRYRDILDHIKRNRQSCNDAQNIILFFSFQVYAFSILIIIM